MKVLLTICASVFWIALAMNEQYCEIECIGRKHIACKNNGNLGPKCDKDAKLITLSQEEKNEFLALHNDLRNDVAAGREEGYSSAVRMASMSWDDELAHLAALNVIRCDMKHDRCHNTKHFKNAGQNVGTWMGFPVVSAEKAMSYVFELWHEECSDTPMSVINKYSRGAVRVGNFALLVNEKNFKVGCAMLRTPQYGMSSYIVACNYAYNNVIGEPVYRTGAPASECKSGKHPNYHSLCSHSEKYDV